MEASVEDLESYRPVCRESGKPLRVKKNEGKDGLRGLDKSEGVELGKDGEVLKRDKRVEAEEECKDEGIKECVETHEVGTDPISLSLQTSQAKQKINYSKIDSDSEYYDQLQLNQLNSKFYSDFSKAIMDEEQLEYFLINNWLSLDLKNSTNNFFCKKMLNVPLGPKRGITFNDLSKPNKHIKNFLTNCIPPNGVQILILKAAILCKIDAYLPIILHLSSKIPKRISLTNFKISSMQLKRFLGANRQKKAMEFTYCKFSFKTVPDFDRYLERTEIQRMYFCCCEEDGFSDWVNHPEEFENFINGLSQSDLKDSLQQVGYGWKCELKRSYVVSIFEKYGLGHVRIHGNFQH
ncbi:unnamed protein product [Moneuplotes crassus]|uniref:Uncharacterized protein n=1 Tax=Euplotes crassus TaxID=5936 RepID=A0AAD1XLL0_EUPCR|nr:unnamed protein product [Moneuplotes crassus]